MACFLAVAVLTAPVLAQTSEVEEAQLAAKADAGRDVSGLRWFGAGCLFNVIGVGLAYLVASTPQSSRLLGKSSEYVDAYTEAHRTAVRSTRMKHAAIGCCVNTMVVIGSAVVIWTALAISDAAEGCNADGCIADIFRLY